MTVILIVAAVMGGFCGVVVWCALVLSARADQQVKKIVCGCDLCTGKLPIDDYLALAQLPSLPPRLTPAQVRAVAQARARNRG